MLLSSIIVNFSKKHLREAHTQSPYNAIFQVAGKHYNPPRSGDAVAHKPQFLHTQCAER
jgi:hypothetical protein